MAITTRTCALCPQLLSQSRGAVASKDTQQESLNFCTPTFKVCGQEHAPAAILVLCYAHELTDNLLQVLVAVVEGLLVVHAPQPVVVESSALPRMPLLSPLPPVHPHVVPHSPP